MSVLLVRVVALSSLVLLATAANGFVTPPIDGTNVLAHKPYLISWVTDWGYGAVVSLEVWQQHVDGLSWAGATLLEPASDPGSYSWTAETLEGLPITEGLHFRLKHNDSSSVYDFNSGTLYIVSSLSTSSTTQSYYSSVPTNITMANSSSFTTVPSSTSASGLQASTKIGLGIGLGVGIPVVLLLLALCVIIHRLYGRLGAQTRTGEIRERDQIIPELTIEDKSRHGWNMFELPAHKPSREAVRPPSEMP